MRVLHVRAKKLTTLRNYPFNDYLLHWDYSSGVSDALKAFNFVLRYNNTTTSNSVISVGGCDLHIINTGIIIDLKHSLCSFSELLVVKFPLICNISSFVWFNADEKDFSSLDGVIRQA